MVMAMVVLAAVLVAAVRAEPAAAHATLVRSDPEFGASLGVTPGTIRLEFDEEISADLSSVEMIGAKTGTVGPLRAVAAGPDALSVELPPLPRDLYRLAWRTVAEDDLHATSGTVVFGVRTAASASSLAAVQSSAPQSAVPAEVAIRWLDFAAIAVLVGALGVVLFVLDAADRRGAGGLERLRRPLLALALAGGLSAIVTGTGLLLIQDARTGGLAALGRVLVQTNYGGYWIVRQVLLLDLVAVVVVLRRARGRHPLRWAVPALALALMFPLALVSHAAALDGAASPATLVIALHTLTAALWVGGVVALCLACGLLVRAGRRDSARVLALSFGGYAAVCVALTAITGVASLGLHVRSLDALVHTSYGHALLLKTGLFLLAGLAGLTVTVGLRWGRAGRLSSAWATLPRLEAALLVAVLVPAALLTASAPARGVAPSQPAQAPVESVQLAASSDDLVFDFRIEPARPGTNFITVGVYQTRRPAPAPVQAVALRVAQPGGGAHTLQLVAVGEDQWRTSTTLAAGRIRLEAAVSRPGLPTTSAATPLNINSPARPAAAPRRAGSCSVRWSPSCVRLRLPPRCCSPLRF